MVPSSSHKQRQRWCAFVSTSSKYRNIDGIEGIEGNEGIEGIVGIEGIESIEGIEQWAFDTKNIEVSRYH